MINCRIIEFMTFEPLEESHFILSALIIVASIEFLTVTIIKVAVIPKFTHSDFFTLPIRITILVLINVILFSALI